ncbi:MAG TPA: hypothetical protein VMH80_27525 [Bryobacteraceae bacterium]|nr:hypothetical protein [Bryobacteraceae bacterium]
MTGATSLLIERSFAPPAKTMKTALATVGLILTAVGLAGLMVFVVYGGDIEFASLPLSGGITLSVGIAMVLTALSIRRKL